MHGRIKVRTTAEHEAAYRAEKLEKAKKFQKGMSRIFDKRKQAEYDAEILKLTANILLSNADVYTLWNIRRETFLKYSETKSKEEMQALYADELVFSEQCLRDNPKCYSAWHQRCWVMKQIPKPDWERELKLCSQYLQMDERNFHCWDYRRFVVENSSVSPEAELAYTTERLNSNFSNFSSWHYRSCLLGRVYPKDSTPSAKLSAILSEELNLGINAMYVDPNDQSAWFYFRWLLHSRLKVGYSENRDSRPNHKSSTNLAVKSKLTKFTFEVTDDILNEQISLLEQLLELEPNNKWTLLTLFCLSKDDDRRKGFLEKLMTLDPAHLNYYADMFSMLSGKHGLT